MLSRAPSAAGRLLGRECGRTPALFACLISVCLAQGAVSQTNHPHRFLDWSYQDGAALLGELPSSAPAAAFGTAALLVPIADFDAAVLEGIQRSDRGLLRGFLRSTNPLGGPKAAPTAAVIFAASLLTGDARFQDAAFTSFQSIIYSGISVYTLKYAVGRLRPETGAGTRAFDVLSGNTSFPSGHTATAFALVTPWVLYYPGPFTYGLMALPVGTAVARIAKDRHWPTDVLAGAAIGFMTARYLSYRHMNSAAQGDEQRVRITPTVAPGAVGVHFRVGLD